ncbi:MAG TPA: TPM domain-containing protein, partial [Bacteroidota bacterium]
MRNLLFALLILTGTSAGQDVPYLSARVNDYAGMLSTQTVYDLEDLLRNHEERTSNQVAVLTVATLEGYVIEEFSIKVADAWKLGQKDKDNGVLFLISRDDRKLRIEVGDGLEGDLTDARCSQIIRHEIVPRFKNGDFDGGIRAGVEAILATIEGSYVVVESDDYASDGGFESFGEKVVALSIFTVVVGMFTFIGLLQPGGAGWF